MKVYIAAKFQAKLDALGLSTLLEKCGYKVTSRWLYQPHLGENPSQKDIREVAIRDFQDIRIADVVIIIENAVYSMEETGIHVRENSGGRWVEMGYALAHHKPVIVLGKINNVFCCLNELVEVVSNRREVVDALRRKFNDLQKRRGVQQMVDSGTQKV